MQYTAQQLQVLKQLGIAVYVPRTPVAIKIFDCVLKNGRSLLFIADWDETKAAEFELLCEKMIGALGEKKVELTLADLPQCADHIFLVLGEQVQKILQNKLPTEQCYFTHGLQALLDNAGLKREVWQLMQGLLQKRDS